METAINNTANVVSAIHTPLQFLALFLLMIFTIAVLLIISNIMDKRNKAEIDKETAVRISERNAEINAMKLKDSQIEEKLENHIEVEHRRYADDFNRLNDRMGEMHTMLTVLLTHLDINIKLTTITGVKK